MPTKKKRLKAGVPKRILEFEKKGLKQSEIADALNRKGLFDANGEPWTQQKISHWLRGRGVRRTRKHERPGKRSPKLQFELPIEAAKPKRRQPARKKRLVKSKPTGQIQPKATDNLEQISPARVHGAKAVQHLEFIPQPERPSLWQSIKQFFTKPMF